MLVIYALRLKAVVSEGPWLEIRLYILNSLEDTFQFVLRVLKNLLAPIWSLGWLSSGTTDVAVLHVKRLPLPPRGSWVHKKRTVLFKVSSDWFVSPYLENLFATFEIKHGKRATYSGLVSLETSTWETLLLFATRVETCSHNSNTRI